MGLGLPVVVSYATQLGLREGGPVLERGGGGIILVLWTPREAWQTLMMGPRFWLHRFGIQASSDIRRSSGQGLG